MDFLYYERTTLRDLTELIRNPREDLHIEIKSWLDLKQKESHANLAQAMLAIANHGGGYVISGLKEESGKWVNDDNVSVNKDLYDQDTINSIVQAFAEPSFHCQSVKVKHPETGLEYHIIIVPGGHKVPIRAKKDGTGNNHVRNNAYYIRRPGPKSETPKTGREWDELIRRCIIAQRDELLDQFRSILYGSGNYTVEENGSMEKPLQVFNGFIDSAYERWTNLAIGQCGPDIVDKLPGVWSVAYQIEGNIRTFDLNQIVTTLNHVEGSESGWPLWGVLYSDEKAPYPYDGFVECWHKENFPDDFFHADYWRVSPYGQLFLIRGLSEDYDYSQKRQPRRYIDFVFYIWRIGELLRHAERLINEIAEDPDSACVRFRISWNGLKGRQLQTIYSSDRVPIHRQKSQQDSVTTELYASHSSLSTNFPEHVYSLIKPLYEIFGFFDPGIVPVKEELAKMRRG